MRWRRAGVPAVLIDPAVADHLEVLDVMGRGRVSVRLLEGVRHAHAFDWLLLNAINVFRRLYTRGFENCGHDVDDVVELGANPTRVVDVSGPRDCQALPRAAEV